MTNALTAAKQTYPAPSKELWLQLTTSRHLRGTEWAEMNCTNAAIVAELRALLPGLEARAKPAGQKAVIAALAPLLTVFPQADRSKAEWATFWSLYAKALEDIPPEGLTAGVEEYVRKPDAEWFPKPGPLRALCEAASGPVWMALGRARATLKLADKHAPKSEQAA